MSMGKRVLATLLVAVGLSAAVFQPALAQDYPKGPIRVIVPVPPGGGVDLLARTIGQKMSTNMGVQVVNEYKPGASAVVGTEELAKSPPDGYTIMMGYTAHATNPLFNPNLPYDTTGFHRGGVRLLHPDRAGGAPVGAGQLGEGADRRWRRRSRASPTPRAAPAPARICRANCQQHLAGCRHDPRALQGQRAGAQRPAGRPRAR